MYIKVLITFMVLSLSLSCAQQESKTPLKVSIGAIAGSAVFTGGLIISGRSTQGAKFVKLVGASDELFLEIPNGNWTFTAIGWDGSFAFEGDSFCDFKPNINLAGEQVNLNMSVTSVKCSEAHYGGHTIATGFNPVTFNSCTDIKKYFLEKGSAAAPENMLCNGASDQPYEGTAKSFKLFIPENDFNSNGSPRFIGDVGSKCYDATSARAITSIRVPWGSNFFHLPYLVKAYPSASCAGNPITYEYRNGFQSLAYNSLAGATPNTSSMNMDLYMDVARCTGTQLTNSPYAAGSTTANKYLICTAAQLVNIAKAGGATCPANALGMGCEVGATYELGTNIDLSALLAGGNSYVVNTLKGQFLGNGYTISNGQRPLFNKFESPDSSSDHPHEFRDVTLSYFTINFTPAAITDSIGIFVNNVLHDGDNADIRIKDIKIDSTSSLNIDEAIAASLTGSYGGLIGYIDHNGSNKRTTLFNNEQLADISTDATGTSTALGGLVGQIDGPVSGSNNGVIVELNTVGLLHSDIDNQNFEVSISAKQKVGGLVGFAQDVQIRFGNRVKAEITAFNKVGGLIGYAKAANETIVENSTTDITYIPSDNNSYSVGGIIGDIFDSDSVKIKGTVSELIIESNANTINSVGGVVGFNNATGAATGTSVNNARAYIETYTNGHSYGGIIGGFTGTSSSSAFINIQNSVAQGQINKFSTPGTNIQRGGLIGNANLIKARMNIAHVNVYGDSEIGGIVGKSAYTELEEIQTFSTITGYDSSNTYVGGAVGRLQNTADNGITDIKSSLIQSTISLPNVVGGCNNTSKCGLLVGDFLGLNTTSNTNVIASQSFILGTIATSDSSPTDQVGGQNGLACIGGCLTNNLYDNLTTNSSCSGFSISPPIAMDSTNTYCTMLFEKQWKKYGYDTNDSYYLAGSEIEPFKVSTPAEWNAIVDDAFLMNKTFELTANLNFNSGNIVPIGSSTNPYTGTIIPNGHKIQDPYAAFTGSNYCGNTGAGFGNNSSDCGVFGVIATGANIGFEHDPLIIETPLFDFSAVGNGAIIGKAEGGKASLRVSYAEFTNTGAATTNMAGLIGEVAGEVFINQSSFHGSLNGSNSSVVGGFVGLVTAATGDLKINSSFANLSMVKTTGQAGGFVGDLGASTAAASIDRSYLKFSISTASDIDITAFGGVSGYLGSTELVYFKNSFIDFTNLNTNTVNTADIRPLAGDSSIGFVNIDNATPAGSAALIGSYGAATYVQTSFSLITPASHTALATSNPIIFSTEGDSSQWYIGNDNLLHLFWEQ